jgi:RNA polymerase sigma-70 factor (ECF subfamily)
VTDELNPLIERWIQGDQAAAAEIFNRYYARVYDFSEKIYGRAVDAEDLAQQAMLSGLEGIRAGQKPDKMTQWLLGIARNQARRRILMQGKRRTARLGRIEQADKSRRSEATEVSRSESRKLLKELLENLPALDRKMLELRYVDEQARRDIADRFGISTETLDKRIARIFGELRERLTRHFTTLVFGDGGASKGPLVRGAVEKLRPSFREVIELRHRDRLSIEEIARELDVPEQTVTARLKYACEQLGCGVDEDLSHLWPEAKEPGG